MILICVCVSGAIRRFFNENHSSLAYAFHITRNSNSFINLIYIVKLDLLFSWMARRRVNITTLLVPFLIGKHVLTIPEVINNEHMFSLMK